MFRAARARWIPFVVAGALTAAIGAVACGDEAPPAAPGGVGGAADGGAGGEGGIGGDGGAPPIQDCDALAEALQASLDQSLETEKAANPARRGGTVGIVITPHCRWTGATGDAELGTALDPSRLMRVASATKTYTAAAVLRAVDEGLLGLDDTVDSFVTTGLMYEDVMTVRQLLNHTAGVADYFADQDFLTQVSNNPDDPVTPQELIDVAIGLGPSFEPGQDFGYANTHYVVLGLILEEVTGQPVHSYIRTTLLEPLGLERTFLDGAETIPEPLAPGWYGTQSTTDFTHPTVGWTAGAMVADVADLGDWIYAMLVGDAVPAALHDEMLDFVTIGSPSLGLGYGLGVFTFVDPGVGGGMAALGHDGALPGYETEVYWVPDAEVLVGIITNNRQSDDEVVWTTLASTAVAMTPAPSD